MPLGECANRHMYNKDKHGDTCPVCGWVSRRSKEEGKTSEELEAMLKLALGKYVCGWLVCTEGINKGRSYAVHPGKTFIGSGDDMDIQILGDDKVDRYRHAVIAYDEKSRKYSMLPGESSGIVYLRGKAVYNPETISEHDEVEIGDSTFVFIPLCDDKFSWSN